jgi:hypothetical protein
MSGSAPETISQLTPATQANDSDIIPVTQGSIGPGSGTTRTVTRAQVIATSLPLSGGTLTGGLTISTGGLAITSGGATIAAGGAAITGNSTVTGTFGVTGSATVTGNTQTNGDTFFGAGGNFFINPDNGGLQLLQFANNQYIQFNVASGFVWNTTGSVSIEANLGVAVLGPLSVTGGGNGIAYSSTNGLVLNQSGGVAATGLIVNVSNIASPFQFFQFGGTTVGSITTNGSVTAYNTTSDYRLKVTFGAAATSALFDAVPVHDAKMEHGERRPMFLAHELQAAAPWAVTGRKDAVDDKNEPVYQQVDHSSLIPAMWAEIRALRSRVAALEPKA